MTRLLDRILSGGDQTERDMSLDGLVEWVTLNGMTFPSYGRSSVVEEVLHSFDGYATDALKANPVVFACVSARLMLFSEARFVWRDVSNGKMFGHTSLLPVEKPSPSRTSQELLALCELDATLAGNAYWASDGDGGLRRLRPDWVGIVTGDPGKGQRSTDLLGYTYVDGGTSSGQPPEIFTPSQVAHFAPIPDPQAHHRGMSWLTPVIRDVQADTAFTKHRLSTAKKGGVHTYAVRYPPLDEDQFRAAVKSFREQYEGPDGSGGSIHVSGGADITPLTMNLRDLDFKAVQAGGETRIAAAARVPAVIAGISEGLAGSSLNQGNYAMARRQFGDLYARPAWRSVCGAFESVLKPPPGSLVLWWDETDIGFLREDQKDAADVLAKKSEAMRQLIDAGYDADSVTEAIEVGDLSILKHTGLFSVQLQEPGTHAGGDQPGDVPALTEGGP